MADSNRTVVLHSVREWLQPTKTWIFEQLRWLPPQIEAHVACERTENLQQFPFPRLHVLSQTSRFERAVDRVGRRARFGALRSPALLALRLCARVIHSHFGPEAWREMAIARATGLPQVVTFYGYDVTRVPASSAEWRKRYRQLFASVAVVLCEGPHMRDELVRLGASPSKVRVQHLGVDIARFAFFPRKWRTGEPLKVLLAAAFREKKGLPDALRAVHAAQARRPELDFRISVVGDAGDDAAGRREKERVLAAAALLGPDKVAFLGFQSHQMLLELSRQHHVLLSPSVRAADGDTEGGAPVTLIELAASGLPVISTKHCDIPNVLREAASSLLAAEHDITGLADRLLWVADHPEECSSIAHFVRQDIEARFDAERQGARLAQVYQELARCEPKPSASLRLRRQAECAADRLQSRRAGPTT